MLRSSGLRADSLLFSVCLCVPNKMRQQAVFGPHTFCFAACDIDYTIQSHNGFFVPSILFARHKFQSVVFLKEQST